MVVFFFTDSTVNIKGDSGNVKSIDYGGAQGGVPTINCVRTKLTVSNFDIKNTSGC